MIPLQRIYFRGPQKLFLFSTKSNITRDVKSTKYDYPPHFKYLGATVGGAVVLGLYYYFSHLEESRKGRKRFINITPEQEIAMGLVESKRIQVIIRDDDLFLICAMQPPFVG